MEERLGIKTLCKAIGVSGYPLQKTGIIGIDIDFDKNVFATQKGYISYNKWDIQSLGSFDDKFHCVSNCIGMRFPYAVSGSNKENGHVKHGDSATGRNSSVCCYEQKDPKPFYQVYDLIPAFFHHTIHAFCK